MGKGFREWVEKRPQKLNPRVSAPHCFLVVLPERGVRRSACYDKTVNRLENAVQAFVGRVFGLERGVNGDYDCPELDGPRLLKLLQDDPEDARRLMANFLLSLMGEQRLALLPQERCETVP